MKGARMIRIALCDDDPHFLQHLHQFVDKWFIEHKIVSSCTEYTSGVVLRDAQEVTGAGSEGHQVLGQGGRFACMYS